MGDWEAELGGASTDALEDHADLVQATVKAITANNCDRRVHLNWDIVEKGRLRKVDTKEILVKNPGYQHYGFAEYAAEFGDLEDNTDKGHRKLTFKGIAGILVPDRDIRKIELNDITASQVVTDIDVAQGLALTDAKDLHRNMDNFCAKSLGELVSGTAPAGVPHTPQKAEGSRGRDTPEPSSGFGARRSPAQTSSGISELRRFMDVFLLIIM